VFFKVFWGTETVSQIFPTVSRNAVEARCINHHQNTLKPRFAAISVFGWNSYDLSKCLIGHQGYTLKEIFLQVFLHCNYFTSYYQSLLLKFMNQSFQKSTNALSGKTCDRHSKRKQLGSCNFFISKQNLIPQLFEDGLPSSSCKDVGGSYIFLSDSSNSAYTSRCCLFICCLKLLVLDGPYLLWSTASTESQGFFISFTSAAATDAMLHITGKSKTLKNSEFRRLYIFTRNESTLWGTILTPSKSKLTFVPKSKSLSRLSLWIVSQYTRDNYCRGKTSKNTSMSAVSQPHLVHNQEIHLDVIERHSKLGTEYIALWKHLIHKSSGGSYVGTAEVQHPLFSRKKCF